MSQKELSRKRGTGRDQPLLTKKTPCHGCQGCGQVAGDTTAAFAAVFCCPCALVHLAALAFVKLPAGLCKKTWKKIRRKVKAKKRIQDKPANDDEEITCQESSVSLTRDELLGSTDAKIRRKVKAKKQIQDKPANDNEEIKCGESSVSLTRDELLGSRDAHGLVKVQIVVSRVSTEECWEAVTGKSHVGFWRNYSLE